MKISATEFKAKCLSLIDKVEASGEAVTITKRGKVVARLVAPNIDPRPWLALRATAAKWTGDPFAPAVDANDVEALK